MKILRQLPALVALVTALVSCSKDDTPSSPAQNDITAIDTKMSTWMSSYNMPGASIAITKNGKLVYRKGYGVADNGSGEKVTVDSRFRIASITKTVTSAAILKLVQEGKLALNQKVFGAGAVLGTTYGTQPYKTYVTDITIDHLLHHTGGGWSTDAPGDPAFYDSSWTTSNLISWTLNNNNLLSAPGTTYRYSNFGYIVLARVIEKASGKSYEDYIRQDILAAAGATKTELCGNNLAQRKPKEVRYYGQGADIPAVYGIVNYTRADGAFGLISTPTDILRFVTAVDSFSTRRDILDANYIKIMRTGSTPNPGYACGWGIEGGEWYWFGSLCGTASFIYRNKEGYCVAIVSNSRLYPNPNNALNALVPIVNSIVTDTITWQDIDQF